MGLLQGGGSLPRRPATHKRRSADSSSTALIPPDERGLSRYHSRVQTSAGISSELSAAVARDLRRGARRQAGVLALLVIASGALLSCALSAALLSAKATAQATCDEERERAGFGRSAATRAMDAPEEQRRFLYRVATDDDGYRVRLVVRAGPFLGDTWERDAYGSMRHAHDVCRDRFSDRLGSRLLARLEDGG